MIRHIQASYSTALNILQRFICDERNIQDTLLFSERLAETFRNGNKVIVFGNGGSAADAMHFAEEFTGRYRADRPALPAIALTDSTHITCVGNDYGFDEIFARGVAAFGKPGDIAVGISTSGNSPNVIQALATAREKGLYTVALLGKDGGKLAGMCDLEFIVPGTTSDRIQEIHMMLLHIVIEGVERILFPGNYPED
jgi:D-sedoheptulose 7-phosphate isomerase